VEQIRTIRELRHEVDIELVEQRKNSLVTGSNPGAAGINADARTRGRRHQPATNTILGFEYQDFGTGLVEPIRTDQTGQTCADDRYINDG
jgi:hypothetical protein